MILAENGGVCAMIGGQRCTFTPNTTTPDGTITRALQGLTTLGNESAENSGIDDPLSSLMGQWFGRWRGIMVSILTALIITLEIPR